MAYRTLNTLQSGRALAALTVLLFHANNTLELPKYLNRPVFPFLQSGNFGVQFFFVLSGFVVFLAHQKDIGRPGMLKTFFWKRFRRVYPPLWIVLLLIVPFYFLFPAFGKEGTRHADTILAAFMISPASYDPILTLEWTLRHEVLFYLIFSLLIWRRSLGVLVGTTWLLLSGIPSWLQLSFPLSFLFATNHLLFAFGIAASYAYKRAVVGLRVARFAAGLGMGIFFVSWIARWRHPFTHIDFLDILFGLGSALMLFAFAVIERADAIRVPALLIFLGEGSYSIYLTHYPVVSLITKVLVYHCSYLPAAAMFLIVSTVAMIAGVAFYLGVERPLISKLGSIDVGSDSHVAGPARASSASNSTRLTEPDYES